MRFYFLTLKFLIFFSSNSENRKVKTKNYTRVMCDILLLLVLLKLLLLFLYFYCCKCCWFYYGIICVSFVVTGNDTTNRQPNAALRQTPCCVVFNLINCRCLVSIAKKYIFQYVYLVAIVCFCIVAGAKLLQSLWYKWKHFGIKKSWINFNAKKNCLKIKYIESFRC